MSGQENTNKRIVVEFYDMAFNQHKPKEAAARHLGSVYRQHNPGVPDGPEAFVTMVSGFVGRFPNLRSETKRVIAEGDLVVLHSNMKVTPDVRGSAAIDIFRVEDGKVVEHWDVVQEVPEKSANDNTMF